MGAHRERERAAREEGIRYGRTGYSPGLSMEELLGPCSKTLSPAPFVSSFQIRDTQIKLPGAHRFWVTPKFSQTSISGALSLVFSPGSCPADPHSSALAVFLV